eukprot:6477265-Amphidinium_carterae.1
MLKLKLALLLLYRFSNDVGWQGHHDLNRNREQTSCSAIKSLSLHEVMLPLEDHSLPARKTQHKFVKRDSSTQLINA